MSKSGLFLLAQTKTRTISRPQPVTWLDPKRSRADANPNPPGPLLGSSLSITLICLFFRAGQTSITGLLLIARICTISCSLDGLTEQRSSACDTDACDSVAVVTRLWASAHSSLQASATAEH